MHTIAPLTEKKIEQTDRRIVAYLATLAGKSAARFCAPTIDKIRFSAAWGMPDTVIEDRLAHLVAVGRITPAVASVNGIAVHGYTVLPARIFSAERAVSVTPGDAWVPTKADRDFLRACGIAAE